MVDDPEAAPKTKRRILFICSWNAVRSPMAEALVNKLFAKDYEASSAGVEASDYVDPFVLSVMRDEERLNLMEYEPRSYDSVPDKNGYDLVVALSENAYEYVKKDKAKNNRPYMVEFWDTPDPPDKNQQREMILAGYKDLLRTIKTHIQNRFDVDIY